MTTRNDIDGIIDKIQILQKVSIEHTDRITSLETPTIDEECVGCCKVVDVAAKLQKELDECRKYLPDNFWAVVGRKNATISQQKNTIEELKDKNIEDLKELYDLDRAEIDRLKYIISARDLSIKSLTIMCQSSGSIRNDLTSTIEDQKRTIDHFISCIGGLEVELSARKEDSAVLMKVVEIVKNLTDGIDDHTNSGLMQVYGLIKDYLDALEGPPETPIDDLYKVTVTYAFLEMP